MKTFQNFLKSSRPKDQASVAELASSISKVVGSQSWQQTSEKITTEREKDIGRELNEHCSKVRQVDCTDEHASGIEKERKILGESSVSTAQRCGRLIAPMEWGSTDRCNLQCNKRLRCNIAIRAQLI